jgi:hypothetical protein
MKKLRKKNLVLYAIGMMVVLSTISVNGWSKSEEIGSACDVTPSSCFSFDMIEENSILDILHRSLPTKTGNNAIGINVTIQGYVMDTVSHKPLYNAQVFCYYVGNQSTEIDILEARTDNDGFYTLWIPCIYNGVVMARYPQYYSVYYPVNDSIPQYFWMNYSLSYGQLPETSKLKGFIRDTESSEPVSEAIILCLWANENKYFDINYTISDCLGYFEMDVKYGTNGFFVLADGYLPFSQQGFLWFDWAETKWINVSIQPFPKDVSTICGYILDSEKGGGVKDASVLVVWNNDVYQNGCNVTRTDAEGFYSINVPQGEGSIHIIHVDYYYFKMDYDWVYAEETYWANGSIEPVVHEDSNKTYRYTWTQHTVEKTIGDALTAGKGAPYEESIFIQVQSGTVITSVEFQLDWEDDVTYGILRKKGFDTLVADISYKTDTKSETSSGNGNHTFVFTINERPKDGTIEAKSREDAVDQIQNDISGKNSALFDISVSVETGERFIRFLKFLKDKGNDFSLSATYTYYTCTVEEISL